MQAFQYIKAEFRIKDITKITEEHTNGFRLNEVAKIDLNKQLDNNTLSVGRVCNK